MKFSLLEYFLIVDFLASFKRGYKCFVEASKDGVLCRTSQTLSLKPQATQDRLPQWKYVVWPCGSVQKCTSTIFLDPKQWDHPGLSSAPSPFHSEMGDSWVSLGCELLEVLFYLSLQGLWWTTCGYRPDEDFAVWLCIVSGVLGIPAIALVWLQQWNCFSLSVAYFLI